MVPPLLPTLATCFQTLVLNLALAASFLIQYQVIATYAGPSLPAKAVATALVAGRLLAAGHRRFRRPPAVFLAALSDLLQVGLSALALSCSVILFYRHFSERVDLGGLIEAIPFEPPLSPSALARALALFFAVLLELALAVVVGEFARANISLASDAPANRTPGDASLAAMERELLAERNRDRLTRQQVIAERERIERRLRQAVADASAGKLAG